MDKFAEKFKDTTLQPQIFSLILLTLILVVFAIIIYRKVAKQEVNKAPDGLLLLTEQYVMGVADLYSEATGDKFTKPAPYIFSLFTLLLVGNLFGLIGLEPPSTSYSFTLTLALISWIGIYVVGIIYHKWRFFKKYINPIEVIGQLAPLISLSFRLFGNLIGGSTIMFLIYWFTGWIWGFIPVIGSFNLLGPIIAWMPHLYFDLFDGLIQGFVFSLLTMVYWSIEADVEESSEVIKEKKSVKEARIREGIKIAQA